MSRTSLARLSVVLAGILWTPQTAPIGSALREGLQLVYESGGVRQAPWVYDTVSVVERAGFERCVAITRRGQAARETCLRGGTLFEPDAGGVLVPVRPVEPRMALTVSTASRNLVHYTTADARLRRVAGRLDVPVIGTTIVTRDATGAIVRRLREDYAPSLLTAVWGIFEEPDGSGGWRSVREFTLTEVRSRP